MTIDPRTAAFLAELDLLLYADSLAQNEIAYEVLAELSDEDLITLGVHPLGHRKRILAAAAKSLEHLSQSPPQRSTRDRSTFHPVQAPEADSEKPASLPTPSTARAESLITAAIPTEEPSETPEGDVFELPISPATPTSTSVPPSLSATEKPESEENHHDLLLTRPQTSGQAERAQPMVSRSRKRLLIATLLASTMAYGAILVTAGIGPPPESLVRDYFAAKEWRDRLSLVAPTDSVEEKMEKHYADWRPGDIDIDSIAMSKGCEDDESPCSATVHLRGENRLGMKIKVTQTVEFVRSGSEWLIDWEATAGWNPMTPQAFAAQRPSYPVRFRAKAELADYFNYEAVRLEGILYSIRLETQSMDKLPYGYVEKDSDNGRRLFELLQDGAQHRVVVALEYFPTGNIAAIVDVVALDSWQIPGGR